MLCAASQCSCYSMRCTRWIAILQDHLQIKKRWKTDVWASRQAEILARNMHFGLLMALLQVPSSTHIATVA
uniref:Uncharacterized protein n=1 Tax=Rhizophora mucronata TaxID=61149 RepID=A0A2P2INI6_RHIMU